MYTTSIWRTLTGTIYIPTTLLSITRGILLLAIPLYINVLGASTEVIGLAVASMSLGSVLADLPAGFVLRRIGEMKTTLLSFFLTAISLLGLYESKTATTIILSTFTLGIGTAFWWLSRHYVLATRIEYVYRGRASALTGATERIGLLIGPIVGGLLIASVGYSMAFASGALITVIALTVYSFSNKTGYEHTNQDGLDNEVVTAQKELGRFTRRVTLLVLGQMLVQVVRYGRNFLIPVYGKLILGLPEVMLGFIMGLSGLLDVAASYPSGVIMDRLGRGVSIGASFTVMSVGLVVMALSSDPFTFTFSVAVIGGGNGLGAGTMLTLGADLGSGYYKKSTAKFLGVWHFVGDVGNAAGPLFLGILAASIGIHNSTIGLAAVSILVAGLMPKVVARSPTSSESFKDRN